MPELPEVETVRLGLRTHAVGRRVQTVTIATDPVSTRRTVRRHDGGAADFADRLTGRTFTAAVRRGKYLWLLTDADEAVVAHLGMSGQFRLGEPGRSAPPHTRLTLRLDDGRDLHFADQRSFGHLLIAPLEPTADGGPGGQGSDAAIVPSVVAHIARDLLDPLTDMGSVASTMRRSGSEVKRLLLDQRVVSGVGNIYADEGLWRARIRFDRAAQGMRADTLRRVLDSTREVMTDALAAGGTSFDELYVDVNGSSGYFDRSLRAYGQEGRPCGRCDALIRRVPFMNRSSFYCPRCQPAGRSASHSTARTRGRG